MGAVLYGRVKGRTREGVAPPWIGGIVMMKLGRRNRRAIVDTIGAEGWISYCAAEGNMSCRSFGE